MIKNWGDGTSFYSSNKLGTKSPTAITIFNHKIKQRMDDLLLGDGAIQTRGTLYFHNHCCEVFLFILKSQNNLMNHKKTENYICTSKL